MLTAEVIHFSNLSSGTNNSFLSLCLRCLKLKMFGWFIICNCVPVLYQLDIVSADAAVYTSTAFSKGY